ncbi:hypothetical protein Pcac1_g15773 [Phytophthora cactorum]|uniref:Uncharacterized protein n=1 Tax=Phytophthora cactorum TaxID=29920 RepID=A0A329RR38_9STRA|nr:hypothetical protein Pcac1_g15773 [Phytophthora cactorum]KAG2834693.1 hypothetical protein PC111_g5719 [Phytophthora cactorum]KAG2902566.1 hypothetical protein PC115_g15547 [Phytophthora cactorum]KAG2903412.1 hypothetical protein PC114_g12273 [Phytophthora cactorum]KAG2987365.1 hypothetical protein PC118_g7313 [Phytophthora cactorum]
MSKRDNVTYLEKETLELHVKTRELKQRWKDDPMRDTGTYDASAAATAKVLGEDEDNADAAKGSKKYILLMKRRRSSWKEALLEQADFCSQQPKWTR